MKTNFKQLTLTASLLACGLGISANAHANAYAVATDNISDGLIVPLVNGTLAPAGSFTFGSPASSSSSSATLNGTGTTSNVTASPPDALASNGTGSNPVRTNEDVTGGYYNLFGQLATAYSWGDSIVVSEQSTTGTPIVARSGAESNIPTTGFADGNGTNSSSTAFSVNLTVGSNCNTTDACTLDFSFLADPYIKTVLDSLASGVVARGTLSFNITITPVGGLVPVFAWAPNGGAGGIVGGTELADAENLNLTEQSLSPGVTQTFSGPYAGGVFGSFHAITDALAAGDYTLGLTMTVHTDVKRTVPEPATLALLGLGLTGLAVIRRRRQS